MEKTIFAILVFLIVCPYLAYGEEKPVVVGGFNNGLGYTQQMKENWDRGTREICESHKQIEPSFKEQEMTKLNVPWFPEADAGEGWLLAFINVTDSVCRGIWRILVAPFPVVQKVQP